MANSSAECTATEGRKRCFALLLVLLALDFNACSFKSGHPQKLAYTIQTVAGVVSKTEIAFAVESGDDGSLHLLWHSEDKGLRYQRSKDDGITWSEPVIVDSTASHVTPRVFCSRSRVHLCWFDNDINTMTIDDRNGLLPKAPTKTLPGPLGEKADVAQWGDSLFLVHMWHKRIAFRRSDDLGLSWSDESIIAQLEGNPLTYTRPAIAAHDNDVYVLWGAPGRLWLSHSGNGGRTWASSQVINTDRRSLSEVYYDDQYNFQSPVIVVCQQYIFVAWEERGLFYQIGERDASAWSRPEWISRNPSRTLSVLCGPGGCIHVAWIDERFQEKDWWGYVPGHQMVTWDADPDWVNNDLFYACVKDGQLSDEILMTPATSYSCWNPSGLRNISVLNRDGKTLLFWSGRKKVGKTLDQFGSPVQLFCSVFSTP